MVNIDIQNMVVLIFLALVVIGGIITLGVCLTPAKEIGVYNIKTEYIDIDNSNFYFKHSPICTNSTSNNSRTISTYLKLKLTIDIDQFLKDEDIDIKGTLGKTYEITIDSTSTLGNRNCYYILAYKYKNEGELNKIYNLPSMNNKFTYILSLLLINCPFLTYFF